MFKIDKDIPLPETIRALGISKYPFAQMKVGDSFAVPAYNGNLRVVARKVTVAATRASRLLTGKRKFTTHAGKREVRCWRYR